MADWHPGSVWQSIVNYADWTRTLDLGATARRLTRLSGPQFRDAVTRLLTFMNTNKGRHGLTNL